MPAPLLHCPNCGDLWKRRGPERFIRLGSPWRQCRICAAWHDSEKKEWRQLKPGQRAIFFAQNLYLILPLAVLFFLSAIFSQFLAMVPVADLWDYSEIVGAFLLALLALLLAWSGLQVLLSWVRARRGIGHPGPGQFAKEGKKFVSDVAWRASSAARPRLSPRLAAPPTTVEPGQEVSGDARFLHPA